MNFHILFVIIFLPTCTILGQARETKQVLTLLSAEKNYLKKADGWYLNKDNREWVKNENMIYREKTEFILSNVYANLDSIRFDKLVYGQDTFYVMLAYKKTGYYEYPTIMSNWKTVNELRYILIYQKDYESLKARLNLFQSTPILIPTYFFGNITDRFDKISEKTLLIKIEEDLDKKIPIINQIKNDWINNKSTRRNYENNFDKYFDAKVYQFSRYYFPISSQKIENKEVVRFLYLISENETQMALKESYFEVAYQDFISILIE